MIENNTITLIKKIRSLDQLKPATLQELLSFLVSKEASPGGPYSLSDNSTDNLKLNEKIYNLFATQGKHLEGVFSYINTQSTIPMSRPTNPTSQSYTQPSQKIHRLIRNDLSSILSPEIYNHISPLIDNIAMVDKDGEISQLARYLQESLSSHATTTFSSNSLSLLGKANFYTWLAYSLYDSAIDDGTQNLITIPAANILQRLAIKTYEQAGVHKSIILNAFTAVDHANVDELLYCRAETTATTITIKTIPSKAFLKKLLSARSSVHYLGLLEILRVQKNSPFHHQKSKQTFNFYLASRQLSDDIHDWENDLRNGRITYVVAHLLQVANVTPGTYKLTLLLRTLQTLYWHSELGHLLKECLNLAYKARAAYEQYLYLSHDSHFNKATILPIITSCLKAQAALQYDKEFLVAMQFNH